MGYALLSDTLYISAVSSDKEPLLDSAVSYLSSFKMMNFGAFFVGKFKDLEALSFERFEEPLKLTDTLDFLADLPSEKILECKLYMFMDSYSLGDSLDANSLSFKIYPVVDYWSHLSNWDSVSREGIVDYSRLVGEFSETIDKTKLPKSFAIDFDKNLALEWLKKWRDYKNGDSSQIVWGLAYVPDENCRIIRRFSGPVVGQDNDASFIKIVYLDSLGQKDSLEIKAAVDKYFVKPPKIEKGEFYVQGGVPIRGALYFDVSSIPPLSAIHAARLVLSIDYARSLIGNYGMDSVFYGHLPADPQNRDTNFVRSYLGEKISDKVVFETIASAIEARNRADGKGVVIFRSADRSNELLELDKVAFYGPDAPDSSKRPKLAILYSPREKLTESVKK